MRRVHTIISIAATEKSPRDSVKGKAACQHQCTYIEISAHLNKNLLVVTRTHQVQVTRVFGDVQTSFLGYNRKEI